MFVVAIVAILAGMTLPDMLGMTDSSRLRKAANELYSNIQKARISALRTSSEWRLIFITEGDVQYYILQGPETDTDGNPVLDTNGNITYKDKAVELPKDVKYGVPEGFSAIPDGTMPDDGVSFIDNNFTLKPDGTVAGLSGTVYLRGEGDRLAFAISVVSTTGRTKVWVNHGTGWGDR
jgi:Tfp pilus assembly protein FimT